MNTYIKTWLTWIVLIFLLIPSLVFLPGWWAIGAFVAIFAVAFTWPRCPRCKLPVYWTKEHGAVDHFAMYRARIAPGRDCARCGQELDGPV